jgi:hypothetical protein
MGWLFAVSLGLQEQRRGAVWGALGPLALGHALAVGAVLVLAAGLGMVLPLGALKWLTAFALLCFGVFHLLRHRHPRLGGMRVGKGRLILWSFLMASAHGAGLMALPFALEVAAPTSYAHHLHSTPQIGKEEANQLAAHALAGIDAAGLLATVAHTAGYLLVSALVAVVVYEKLGLRLLRTAWINVNTLWAGALVLTALLTPLL